jgi:hypothetical protein
LSASGGGSSITSIWTSDSKFTLNGKFFCHPAPVFTILSAKSPFCTSDGSEVDDSLKFGSYVLMDKSDDKVP